MRAKTKKTGLTSRCLNVIIILLSQNSARFKIVFPSQVTIVHTANWFMVCSTRYSCKAQRHPTAKTAPRSTIPTPSTSEFLTLLVEVVRNCPHSSSH